MIEPVWPDGPMPKDLGAVVLGPVLLGRASGVAVGLRCVFAHPTGLHLPLVLVATGGDADRANRASFPSRDSAPTFRLLAEANGKHGPVDQWRQESQGWDGHFAMRADYWVAELPHDRVLALTVAWPEIGLPLTSTTHHLEPLADLDSRVVSLPSFPGARSCRVELGAGRYTLQLE